MSKFRRGRVVVAGLLAFTSMIALPGSAHAQPRVISYQCAGDTPLGSIIGVTYQDLVDVDAPSTIPPRTTMNIQITPAPNVMLSHVDNRPVESVQDIEWKILLPTSASYVTTTLSGGSGTGPVTVTKLSNALRFNAPGPIAGGAEFQLPTITITVRSLSSGTVRLRLAGYSLENPGLSFIARIQGSTITADVPTSCYANPDVTLSSTQIV